MVSVRESRAFELGRIRRPKLPRIITLILTEIATISRSDVFTGVLDGII